MPVPRGDMDRHIAFDYCEVGERALLLTIYIRTRRQKRPYRIRVTCACGEQQGGRPIDLIRRGVEAKPLEEAVGLHDAVVSQAMCRQALRDGTPQRHEMPPLPPAPRSPKIGQFILIQFPDAVGEHRSIVLASELSGTHRIDKKGMRPELHNLMCSPNDNDPSICTSQSSRQTFEAAPAPAFPSEIIDEVPVFVLDHGREHKEVRALFHVATQRSNRAREAVGDVDGFEWLYPRPRLGDAEVIVPHVPRLDSLQVFGSHRRPHSMQKRADKVYVNIQRAD
mmetsp:Transcript_121386/g.350487  ORF Transcript_121386/g.350487 Transcript_121386/m.350487 type:complete len:280 (-) Transcript_121386:355-1194(-)